MQLVHHAGVSFYALAYGVRVSGADAAHERCASHRGQVATRRTASSSQAHIAAALGTTPGQLLILSCRPHGLCHRAESEPGAALLPHLDKLGFQVLLAQNR